MYLKEVNFKALSTFFHEIATSVPGKKAYSHGEFSSVVRIY